MKVVASVKPICKDCYLVRRGKVLYMRCKSSPRHKRRQGFSTFMTRPGIQGMPQMAETIEHGHGDCQCCNTQFEVP